MTGPLLFLGVNLVLVTILMLAAWQVAVGIRDVSFVDAIWPLGMVLLALASLIRVPLPDDRAVLIALLTAAWGLRLGWHLFSRWREHGVDPRYKKLLGSAMETNRWDFAKASLLRVFALQGPLLLLVCLPAQLGIWASDGVPLGWLGWLGALVALTGIAFETVGDAQLKAFRTNPANQGKVLDTGLWRYTRHPNYFGDACTWWGIWLIAAETGVAGWVSIVGPIFLTFTLVRWSGAALLEKGLRKSRPEYDDYIARTSSFIPMPPSKPRETP